jgi:bifunctional ADP-heptose synthase (sugar kinase/adenylyltransferase)
MSEEHSPVFLTAGAGSRLFGERPRQRKVIMCHGVFDVVRPGHLRHLLYARPRPIFSSPV